MSTNSEEADFLTKTAIEDWLLAKGTVLWGDFDVSSFDRRTAAVEWFFKEMKSFGEFYFQRHGLLRNTPARTYGKLSDVPRPTNPVVRGGGLVVRGEILGKPSGPYSHEDKFGADYDVVTGDEGHLATNPIGPISPEDNAACDRKHGY